MEITKKLSDEICTAITLGHLVKYAEDNKNPITIVYETKDEIQAYDSLKEKLKEYGCEINPQHIPAEARKELLITAKNGIYTSDILKQYNEEMTNILTQYNEKINKAKGGAVLYGAYIGGKYNAANKILRLLSPSQLISKESIYYLKEITREQLQVKYNENREIIQHIIDTLKKANGKDIHLELDEINVIPEKAILEKTDIFGSIHGLVNAIIHYNLFNSAEKDAFACELACSDDTTKVGSCIPCSIFASSNKTPANYTHFGRGDYWNMPQISEGYMALNIKRNAWEQYVINCFEKGVAILNKHNKLMDFAKINKTEIPEIFLHSLMYEGKFIDKLNQVLNR